MLFYKYQVVRRADHSPVIEDLFDRPIDAECYVNAMHNIKFDKSDVMIIQVFVVE